MPSTNDRTAITYPNGAIVLGPVPAVFTIMLARMVVLGDIDRDEVCPKQFPSEHDARLRAEQLGKGWEATTRGDATLVRRTETVDPAAPVNPVDPVTAADYPDEVCHFCRKSLPYDAAVASSWVPYFYRGQTEVSEPVCRDCVVEGCVKLADGEYEEVGYFVESNHPQRVLAIDQLDDDVTPHIDADNREAILVLRPGEAHLPFADAEERSVWGFVTRLSPAMTAKALVRDAKVLGIGLDATGALLDAIGLDPDLVPAGTTACEPCGRADVSSAKPCPHMTVAGAVTVDASLAAASAWHHLDYDGEGGCGMEYVIVAPDGTVALVLDGQVLGMGETEEEAREDGDPRLVCQHRELDGGEICGQRIVGGHHVGLGREVDEETDADHRALDWRCLVSGSPMQGRSAVDPKQYVGADQAHGVFMVPLADVTLMGSNKPIVAIEIHKLPPNPEAPADGNWLGYSPVWVRGDGYETDDIHTSLAELCADYGIPLDLVLDRMAVALLRPAAPEAPAPSLIVLPSGKVVGSGVDKLHAWADARSERVDLEGARCVGLADVPGAGKPGGPCITAPGVLCSCDDCMCAASATAHAGDDGEMTS